MTNIYKIFRNVNALDIERFMTDIYRHPVFTINDNAATLLQMFYKEFKEFILDHINEDALCWIEDELDFSDRINMIAGRGVPYEAYIPLVELLMQEYSPEQYLEDKAKADKLNTAVERELERRL